MLRRQGVVHENQQSIQKRPPPAPQPSAANNSSQPVDPTSLKIKQLIQSKNPGRVDIHAANLLIQNFYEIEKRKTLRVQEIRKGRENVAVLDSMIDHYSATESSTDDVQLMRELYTFCKSLQPTIVLLTEDPQQEVQIMQDALETNDLLLQVVEKYESIMVQGDQTPEMRTQGEDHDDALISIDEGVGGGSDGQENNYETPTVDVLENIFGSIESTSESLSMDNNKLSDILMLIPQNSSNKGSTNVGPSVLPTETAKEKAGNKSVAENEMDSIISEMLKATVKKAPEEPEKEPVVHDFDGITVDLEAIEPASDLPPRTIFNEPKGLKMVLNFTKEHPREDISVIVAIVANQSPSLITDMDVVFLPANNDCEVRVVDTEGSEKRSLAGMKRFSSADDFALIVLVSNPCKVAVPLWNITIKYCVDGVEHKELLSVSDLTY